MSRFTLEVVPEGGATRDEERACLDACHEIRRVVFVEEQRVDAALEWDELDELGEHYLARRAEDGVALGTARFRVVEGKGKAERVAVHAVARKTGVGRFLMEVLAERARASTRAASTPRSS